MFPSTSVTRAPRPRRACNALQKRLRQHGLTVEIVDSVIDARGTVNGLLANDKNIFTATSETLRESGIAEDVEESGRFRSTRRAMARLTTRRSQMRFGVWAPHPRSSSAESTL